MNLIIYVLFIILVFYVDGGIKFNTYIYIYYNFFLIY